MKIMKSHCCGESWGFFNLERELAGQKNIVQDSLPLTLGGNN